MIGHNRIVQRINDALERKQHCSAAFLDITQAFNKVYCILASCYIRLTLNICSSTWLATSHRRKIGITERELLEESIL
jgi:hypothetical protein